MSYLSKDDYLNVNFEDDFYFKSYISYLKDISIYKSNIDISSNDKIITLYTCSYEFKNAHTIVNAKLISVK